MRWLFSSLLFCGTIFAQSAAQIAPPLYGFLPNTGQFPPAVRFFHYAVDNYFYLTRDSFVLSNRVRVQLAGVSSTVKPVGVSPSAPVYNIYQGNDSSKWIVNSPLFGAVQLATVYPGVSAAFTTSLVPTTDGNVGQVVFKIAPGADPGPIRINVLNTGTTPFVGAGNGIWYAGGNISGTFILSVQASQVSGGVSVPVDSNLKIESDNSLSLQIANRNTALETDVVVSFPDYDNFEDVLSGNVVAAAVEFPSDFEEDGALPGPVCDPTCTSALFAHLDKKENALWVSILGGRTGGTLGNAATQAVEGVAVSGQTIASDFPITVNASHETLGSQSDLFLALLDSGSGHLLDSTYADLPFLAEISDLTAGPNGDVAVSGAIVASDNQMTGYVLRWQPAQNKIIFALPFESAVQSLAFDSGSNLYFVSTQNSPAKPVLVGELDPVGNVVGSIVSVPVPASGTAFGASELLPIDGGDVWAVFNVGAGSSSSAFAARVSPTHNQVLVNRRLVNQGNASDIALTPIGNLKLLIEGASPTEMTAPDAALVGQCYLSKYFMILGPDGTTIYATYTGQLFDLASQNENTGPPTPSVACFVNASSRYADSGFVAAPGQIIEVTGGGFGPANPIYNSPDSTGRYPLKAGGFTVKIGGNYAPVFSVARGTITVQVPFELSATTAPLTLQVFENGNALNPIQLGVTPTFLGFFETGAWNDQTDLPVLAASNEDGTINSADNPAPVGSIVSLFGTGLGLLSPPLKTGRLNPLPPSGPLSRTALLSECWNCGDILYLGSAPGLSTGIVQANIRIPQNSPGEGPRPLSINVSLGATQEELSYSIVTYGVIFIK